MDAQEMAKFYQGEVVYNEEDGRNVFFFIATLLLIAL